MSSQVENDNQKINVLIEERVKLMKLLNEYQFKRNNFLNEISLLEDERNTRIDIEKLNKEEESNYIDKIMKIRFEIEQIKIKENKLELEIASKEKQIKKYQEEQIKRFEKINYELKKTSEDMNVKTKKLQEENTQRLEKLSKMYKYINSDASKKDKKIAQIKVYLTEYELKVLENLVEHRGSDKSSVMRDLLKAEDISELPPEKKKDQKYTSQYVMKYYQPKKFEDIYEYVNLLGKGYSIIINFELINDTDHNISQRFIDFISGAVFQSGGKITKIGSSTIICSTEVSNVLVVSESHENQLSK